MNDLVNEAISILVGSGAGLGVYGIALLLAEHGVDSEWFLSLVIIALITILTIEALEES